MLRGNPVFTHKVNDCDDWANYLESIVFRDGVDAAVFMVKNELLLAQSEAVLSSKIEGTQATLEEVLEFESGQTAFQEEKKADIREILNYRRAIMLSKDAIQERPITLSLVKQLHGILLDGVRGQNRIPGEFRTTQNWIGSLGSSIENAISALGEDTC